MGRRAVLAGLLCATAATPRSSPAPPLTGQCDAVANASRLPCGIYETRKDNMHGGYDFGAACHARGCCYLPLDGGAAESASPNCFWPGAAVPVKTAHLVQSNHFDAGFTDQLNAVVNSYFDTFFPGAVALAAELRARGGEERLRWMTQSWLVAIYLDCPAIKAELPVLHCPNASAVASVEAAVRRGDIWWHAFPHNAELAAADAVRQACSPPLSCIQFRHLIPSHALIVWG